MIRITGVDQTDECPPLGHQCELWGPMELTRHPPQKIPRQHFGWAYIRRGARLLAFFRPFYAILHTQCDALKFSCEFAQSFTCCIITHPVGQLARLFCALMPVSGIIDKIFGHEISPPSTLN